MEAKLENNNEERRALLERCLASEGELEKLREKNNEMRRKLDDTQAALHELGRENQSLQVSLVTFPIFWCFNIENIIQFQKQINYTKYIKTEYLLDIFIQIICQRRCNRNPVHARLKQNGNVRDLS